jgi:hypothetical protein
MGCLMDGSGDGNPEFCARKGVREGGAGKARISRASQHHMTSKRNSRIDRASVTMPIKRCKIICLTFKLFKRVCITASADD